MLVNQHSLTDHNSYTQIIGYYQNQLLQKSSKQLPITYI